MTMTTAWQDFLDTQGAIYQDGYLQSFGAPKAELEACTTSNVLTSLSHLGILQVSGEDAVSFLQGQVTNDVKQLDGSNSQYAGYCSPKGRLLALFLAFAHQDHCHLQMPASLIEPIMKRLKMYVMRSKVTIEDKSADILCFGLAGKEAEASLSALFKTAPSKAHDLITLEDATLLRLAGDWPRFEVFTNQQNAERIWNALAAKAVKVGKPAWDYLEIQAGIPEIVPATQEAFVPQMVNLDALDGINFKKGCYTGQEIVARTHYLGKVKRRTQLAHIASTTSPQAGDHIQANGADEAIGQIVRAAPCVDGGFDVLVEIRLENLADELTTVVWNGQPLSFKALPYSLT
jgi:folate-binding protein YgfZ